MNTASMDYSEIRIIRNRMNRNRELKRRVSLVVLGLFIAFVIFMIFTCASANAKDINDKALFKYYKSVQVQSGDTIDSIADEYICEAKYSKKKFVKEIAFINNIEDTNYIQAGSYIIVPYYDEYRG